MKKNYLTPDIRIQAIDASDFMDVSIPILDDKSEQGGDLLIDDGTKVLSNGSSVWDIEEEE